MEALDLPAGDGDLADQIHGFPVDGGVDLDQLVEEAEVGLALRVAQDGGIRGDEGGEFFGEFAGLDAVAGGVRLSGFGGRTMRFGPVFAGSVGSFLGGHTFLLLKWKKALVFGESLFPEFVAHLARFI